MSDEQPVEQFPDEQLPEDPGQMSLLDVAPDWRPLWEGMPAFNQQDLKPVDQINVQFLKAEDKIAFLKLVGYPPARLQSIWYPKMESLHLSQRDAPAVTVEPNLYPIYIISKGRWEQRLTSNALEKLGIPYHIVVEPQELENYAAVISREKILVLPFSNLGQGSIPARNWVWEHSVEVVKADRHWILDDNMDGFYRLNNNLKHRITDSNPFLPIEQFADRYENVALAGMNYEFFADRRANLPPFLLNTRIYSCILIKNDIPFLWRGRYNEDTDLSLRALKAGWCTVLFNAILAKKATTMTMKGGNTDELYQGDGRRKMAESLLEQHPDCVRIIFKWGRFQHHVHYKIFRGNKLIPKPVPQPQTKG
jgi:hypothetical protein